jgi:hypothetical protein
VVWENLGWFYKVVKGVFEVYPNSFGKVTEYTTYFQGTQQFIAKAETPEDALGLLRQNIRTTLRRIEDELADAA